MNYLTVFFNEQRIVPARNLRVPLCEIGNEPRISPLPLIYEGKLYTADKQNGLRACDEKTDDITGEADIQFQRAGIFAAGSVGMCVRAANGDFHRVTWDTLDTVEICADAPYFWNGHDTFSRAEFSILDSKEGEGLRAPKYITRKEFNNCDPIWRFRPDVPRAGFGASDDYVVVQDVNGKVYVLDITSGEMIWNKSTEELGVLTPEEIQTKNKGVAKDYPHILENVIVLGSHYDYLIGVDLYSGDLIWKRKIEGNTAFPCVTEDGRVYKFTNFRTRKNLLILDAVTGETVQEWDLSGVAEKLGITDILHYQSYGDVTETHFWGTTTTGLLFAVNLSNGNIDWHQNLGEEIPFGDPFIICNNRLYMTTMNQLITFEGADGYIED